MKGTCKTSSYPWRCNRLRDFRARHGEAQAIHRRAVSCHSPYELSGSWIVRGDLSSHQGNGTVRSGELEGTMTVATPPGQRLEMAANILSRSVDLRDIASSRQPARATRNARSDGAAAG